MHNVLKILETKLSDLKEIENFVKVFNMRLGIQWRMCFIQNNEHSGLSKIHVSPTPW